MNIYDERGFCKLNKAIILFIYSPVATYTFLLPLINWMRRRNGFVRSFIVTNTLCFNDIFFMVFKLITSVSVFTGLNSIELS